MEKTSVKYIALPASLPSGLNNNEGSKSFGWGIGVPVPRCCGNSEIGMLVVRARDGGEENPWGTSTSSSLNARPIPSGDFELCVLCSLS